jgi:hypothetical protein
MGHNKNPGIPLLAFIAGALTWALFGDKIKQKVFEMADFENLKKEVEIKFQKASDYSQETYNKIVDEVATDYGKLRGISQNELVDLMDDLKMHFRRIKRAWNSD